MTEAEWLASEDRQPMLEGFQGRFSDRKLRLFACACCRHIWGYLAEESRQALIIAEQYADGLIGREELDAAGDAACGVVESAEGEAVGFATHRDAELAALNAPYSAAGQECVLGWPGRNETHPEQAAQEHAYFAELLRDIFGNPFHPVAFDPTWRTSDVLLLAQGIYDERAFDRMPILADALQDAGCDNEAILAHCRDATRPHVRGCWVIDRVLGKE
jgi:hypothetical protein